MTLPPAAVSARRSGRRAPPQGGANEIEQLVGAVGFCEEGEGAGGQGAGPGGGAGMAGDDDDRHAVAAPAQGREDVKSAHGRHVQVEQQAVPRRRPHGVEKFAARGEPPRRQPLALEQDLQRVARRLIIVKDKDHHVWSPLVLLGPAVIHHLDVDQIGARDMDPIDASAYSRAT